MIITYLRSSSYAAWDFCPHRYYLEYVLGLPTKSGKAAEKGNIVHKALEVLANGEKARQSGLTKFTDETFGELTLNQAQPDYLFERAFDHYNKNSDHNYNKKDYDEINSWMWAILRYDNGAYDPRKLNIVDAEPFFDFELKHDWAHYKYDLPDGPLEGQLRLRGTVDLVTTENGLYHVIDYKTGKRKDWATEQPKDYKKLKNDSQLRIYHLAVKELYGITDILVSIMFINDGGPFTIPFTKADFPETERILQKRFETIRDNTRPQLKITWKCGRICKYGETDNGNKKSVCEIFRDKIRYEGIDNVTQKYSINKAYNNYGDGGGRQIQK